MKDGVVEENRLHESKDKENGNEDKRFEKGITRKVNIEEDGIGYTILG